MKAHIFFHLVSLVNLRHMTRAQKVPGIWGRVKNIHIYAHVKSVRMCAKMILLNNLILRSNLIEIMGERATFVGHYCIFLSNKFRQTRTYLLCVLVLLYSSTDIFGHRILYSNSYTSLHHFWNGEQEYAISFSLINSSHLLCDEKKAYFVLAFWRKHVSLNNL